MKYQFRQDLQIFKFQTLLHRLLILNRSVINSKRASPQLRCVMYDEFKFSESIVNAFASFFCSVFNQSVPNNVNNTLPDK